MSRQWEGITCPIHRGRYRAGCEGCRAYSRTKGQRAARRARPGRVEWTGISQTPADLTLEAYRQADPFAVDFLVAEFGSEAAALRLLNGKPHGPHGELAPFDPALLAPAGAKAIPKARGSGNGVGRMIETGGP